MQVYTGLAGADPEISERGHRDPQFLKAGGDGGWRGKNFLFKRCFFSVFFMQNVSKIGGVRGGG